MKQLKNDLTKKNREIFKNNPDIFKGDFRKSIDNAFIKVIEIQKKQGIAPFSLPDKRNYWAEGTESEKLGKSKLYKIYNLGRYISSRPVSKKDCILCVNQRIKDNDVGVIIDNEWEAKANTYPIFEKHGNIIHRDHIKQELKKQDIKKVFDWLKQSPQIKFFYNGFSAGATEKEHKHIQYFSGFEPYKALRPLKNKLPIEFFEKEILSEKNKARIFKISGFPNLEKQILIISLESKGRGLTSTLADFLWEILGLIKKQGLDYNILWTSDNNKIKVFITPRTEEKLTGPAPNIILSERTKSRGLAAIEFSGLFIAFDKEQYQKITYNDFARALNKLGLSIKNNKARSLLNKF